MRRRNDALKLILAWGEKGDVGWGMMVEKYIDQANYLQSKVEEHQDSEMMSSRVWSIVFMRFTSEGVDHNYLNKKLRERLVRTGGFMISQSNIGDDVILRPVIANPAVTTETIDGLVEEIERHTILKLSPRGGCIMPEGAPDWWGDSYQFFLEDP